MVPVGNSGCLLCMSFGVGLKKEDSKKTREVEECKHTLIF